MLSVQRAKRPQTEKSKPDDERKYKNIGDVKMTSNEKHAPGRNSPSWSNTGSMQFLKHTLGPLVLVLLCPVVIILVHLLNTEYDGRVQGIWRLQWRHRVMQHYFPILSVGPASLLKQSLVEAAAYVYIFIGVQYVLLRCLPGPIVMGPTTESSHTPQYKDNGFLAYLTTLILFACGTYTGIVKPHFVCDNFGEILTVLNLTAFALCLYLALKRLEAPKDTRLSDCSASGNFIFDFYWGRELHPKIFGVDVKHLTNCRIGMMAWPILVLCHVYKQCQLIQKRPSNSIIISSALQLLYVTKFFLWEAGYLRSLDVMHDRAGFYICWGCLCWVPGIYTSVTQFLIRHPFRIPTVPAIIIFSLGALSVSLNYFADLQRQVVRRKALEILGIGGRIESPIDSESKVTGKLFGSRNPTVCAQRADSAQDTALKEAGTYCDTLPPKTGLHNRKGEYLKKESSDSLLCSEAAEELSTHDTCGGQDSESSEDNYTLTFAGAEMKVLVAPYTTENGERFQNVLLVSGCWGIARHFHYLPEILGALCWTLPCGYSYPLPYFYVAFLTILLIDRAQRDDLRCQMKYKHVWEQYKSIVRFKIFPGLY